MSFRCRHCGAELVRRPGASVRRSPPSSPPPPGAMPVPAGATAAAVALDNPYQAPQAMNAAPFRVAGGEKALASRGSRLAAQLLDGLAGMIALSPMIVAGALSPQFQAEPSAGWYLLTFLALIGLAFYQMRLLANEGQTIGKRAMKIRIVRYDDGSNPGFGKVVGLRLLVSNFVCGLIPLVGPLVDILFIFTAERRCLHDYIAGTKVVEA